MTSTATQVLLCIGAYVIGSIPFGVVVARAKGVDLRQVGSGNIGATNVARVLGASVGLIVLLLDAAKGALPTLVALHYCGWASVIAATGAAAILGHCFSPFLAGKGGKGVATSFGVFLVIAPALAGIAVLAFLVIWRITRVPALGSLAGSAALSALFIARGELHYTILACATTALLVYTHRSNLANLTSARR
jgi:glycerol-3-phosphate acyltransferase PlsY